MGMIPELKTAFCGCSVRTGTKVIGWVTMVLGILEFLAISGAIGILTLLVSSTNDEKLGENAIKMLHDTEYENSDKQGAETLHSILVLLIGNTDGDETRDPEYIGTKLKDTLHAIFFVTFLVVLVVTLFHVLFTSLLLVGAYKKKAGYVLFYLVISILGLIGYLPLIFSNFTAWNFKISTVIGCLIHLYFTWVIYSFYKELRNPHNYASNKSMVMLLPGEKHLQGDVPILAPTGVAYNY